MGRRQKLSGGLDLPTGLEDYALPRKKRKRMPKDCEEKMKLFIEEQVEGEPLVFSKWKKRIKGIDWSTFDRVLDGTVTVQECKRKVEIWGPHFDWDPLSEEENSIISANRHKAPKDIQSLLISHNEKHNPSSWKGRSPQTIKNARNNFINQGELVESVTPDFGNLDFGVPEVGPDDRLHAEFVSSIWNSSAADFQIFQSELLRGEP